jgi:short-subunit dehydrogenase
VFNNNQQAKFWQDKRIWIVGASSGIGADLALSLANLNIADLVISARNEDALRTIAQSCQTQGKQASYYAMDIADYCVASNNVRAILHNHQPNIVIFMAGIYDPTKIMAMSDENIDNTVNINLTAAMKFSRDVVNYYQANDIKGMIAVCASVAGYLGLKNAQPYSATKAALINFCESLRWESRAYDIDVKVINPGFVKTRLTDKNNFKMPFRVSSAKAAEYIIKGLGRSKLFEIHFPKRFSYIMKLWACLPYIIRLR